MAEKRKNGGKEDDPLYAGLVRATRFEHLRREAAATTQRLTEIQLMLWIPEVLVKIASERLEEDIVPMIEKYFEPGDFFGLEQLISIPAPPPFQIDSE